MCRKKKLHIRKRGDGETKYAVYEGRAACALRSSENWVEFQKASHSQSEARQGKVLSGTEARERANGKHMGDMCCT